MSLELILLVVGLALAAATAYAMSRGLYHPLAGLEIMTGPLAFWCLFMAFWHFTGVINLSPEYVLQCEQSYCYWVEK